MTNVPVMIPTFPAAHRSRSHMTTHEYYMKIALVLAENALARGEFPVGCIIVVDDLIMAEGKRSHSIGKGSNEIDHAEIHALRDFSSLQRGIDKNRATLYSTLEPCLMCYGACMISGIGKIVYAYEDAMGGGTGCNLERLPPLYREISMTITKNVLRHESLKLFAEFFKNPENQYLKNSLLARTTLSQAQILDRNVS